MDANVDSGFSRVVAPPESEKSSAKKHVDAITMGLINHALRLLMPSPLTWNFEIFPVVLSTFFPNEFFPPYRAVELSLRSAQQNPPRRIWEGNLVPSPILNGGDGMLLHPGGDQNAANTLSKSAYQTSTKKSVLPYRAVPLPRLGLKLRRGKIRFL